MKSPLPKVKVLASTLNFSGANLVPKVTLSEAKVKAPVPLTLNFCKKPSPLIIPRVLRSTASLTTNFVAAVLLNTTSPEPLVKLAKVAFFSITTFGV